MLHLRVPGLAEQLHERRQALAREVGPGGTLGGTEEGRRVQDRLGTDVRPDRLEQDLLALHAPVVAVHVAASSVGERLAAVEVLLARLDPELDGPLDGVRVAVVGDRLRHVDVDASHGVHDADDAVKVHDEDRIDRTAGDLARDRSHGTDALDGPLAGPQARMTRGRLHVHLIEQARLAPAG